MSKISLRDTSSTRLSHQRRKQWLEVDPRLKPFGFCCSLERFDPLSRYDQRKPPYKSSLTAITSLHECPVSKMQTQFFTPRLSRNKKRLTKKMSNTGNQQQLGNDKLNYFQISRSDRSIKWYLEDEIALAKNIFWTERQRVYNEEQEKIVSIGRKQIKKKMKRLLHLQCPRWYQDFSTNQMNNLMNLENVMRTDYKEITTSGTQKLLMAIGVVSTFFKLKPIVIKELHKSCNLNGVIFLREVYKILTGNDFSEEGYKEFYDCNERIILSAIAFLTLSQTVEELHKRLPAMIMPKIPSKPKPPICLPRRKDICPYKEELFRRPDWASYRNNLQKWQNKLLVIPKVILPLQKYNQVFNDGTFEIRNKQEKAIEYLKKDIISKELQKICTTKLDQSSITSIDHQTKRKKDFSKQEIAEVKKSTSNVPQLSDKTLSIPKPPRASQKSWLGEKDAHYVISGACEDPTNTVIYEINGVANVTPSHSDEKFFAVLKRDKPKKVFPSGRENLSRNWQEWLQNADEEFRQKKDKADELIKSIRSITKLTFPGPVCDSCCLCRQTRKTREKIRQTKTPHLLIDNIVQNGEKNRYIVGSMAMHSPGPSPTESPTDLLEMVPSHDEIKTHIIINGVTNQNGTAQYHILDIQKDKIHIPSQISDRPVSQPVVRNVPPCACAIQQISKENHASSILSKDDISWTKDEGLCPGKKYRPNESGAYSCKKYPGDKSCRHNPFMKEILKIRKEEKEEEEEEKKKDKAEVIDTIKKVVQSTPEKKRDKFIPDLNYPAYDNPWNILRTAPSDTSKTDYEHTLKLTSPALPATATSEAQKRQQNISPSNKELDKFAESTKNKKDKVSDNVSSNVSKRIEKQNPKRNNMNNQIKQNQKKPLNKIMADKRDIKFATTFKSTVQNKINKPQLRISSPNKINNQQQSKNVDKAHKYASIKQRGRKKIVNEIEELENRKQEMMRLKNMLKLPMEVLGNIQPAILPEELQTTRQSEENPEDSDSAIDEEESHIKNGPCGWRTKSEQELPAKKTLAYLCEPDYPLETMAIRPDGRPCECRENRSKKKILKYNVGGLIEQNGRRGAKRTKLKEENRIIDGVVYFTPPASPRRSDEYIPEYDLLESPYDMCAGETTDKVLKLIEKYSGPKSLLAKKRKRRKLCSCNSVAKETGLADQKKDIEETRQKLMEAKSPEERWSMALKDKALMDYFTQRKDKTVCWTTCRKFARSVRPRRLKMMKPVCECKNERKIVERNEERSRWKMRQRRLKALEKQAFMHVVDTSRPMVDDARLVISEVTKIPGKTEHESDVKYNISGVTKDLSMSPPQQIVDGLKMSTPIHTPEPSKEDILSIALHRHWSPMHIPPGPLPKKDVALKEEMNRRKKARDEASMLIYGAVNKQDAFSIPSMSHTFQKMCNQEKQNTERKQEIWKSHINIQEKTSEAVIETQSPSKKTDSKKERQQDASDQIISKIIEGEKHFNEVIDKISYQPDASHKQIIEETEKKIYEQRDQITDSDDKKRTSSQSNLTAMIKTELKKMSGEGYVFAELPKCYLMPQLQEWIMHREGVVFSEIDKKKMMRETNLNWELQKAVPLPKFKAPSLHMTKRQLKKLTYDQTEEIKKKIEEEKALFHSKVRKARVSFARTMWSTMEYEKFPCASFKNAFFTYMPSKEADGHVYKPWFTSEANERDTNFSCYQ